MKKYIQNDGEELKSKERNFLKNDYKSITLTHENMKTFYFVLLITYKSFHNM